MNSFPSSRTISSSVQDGLTSILSRIDKPLQRLAADKGRPQDGCMLRRGGPSRPSPKRPFLLSAKFHCKYHKRFGDSAKYMTRGADSLVRGRETRSPAPGCGSRHRAIYLLSPPERQGFENNPTIAFGQMTILV